MRRIAFVFTKTFTLFRVAQPLNLYAVCPSQSRLTKTLRFRPENRSISSRSFKARTPTNSASTPVLIRLHFDVAPDYFARELFADRSARQEDGKDVEPRRRRLNDLRAFRLNFDRRHLRVLLAAVPRRNFLLGNQNLERARLAWMTKDQPFFLKCLHHLVHRWRRNAHGSSDLGFCRRVPMQAGVGVDKCQIAPLSRCEAGHESLPYFLLGDVRHR
jgi:hypothetical protein